MKITDFKVIEAQTIQQLTELVKADLPTWSVVGSLIAERIPTVSPDEVTGEYSRTVYKITLGIEQTSMPVSPESIVLPRRLVEGASIEEALQALAKKKTKSAARK